MFTITQVKENLIAMGHSGSLNKVRNFEAACERAANTMLAKAKLLEQQRAVALTQTVHEDLFNYALPSDFYSLIDLYPQGDRTNRDLSKRVLSSRFDLLKALRRKEITIDGSEGSKRIRINWRICSPKTLHIMDSYDGNGTWTAVGSATNITTDTIIKYSGGGSVRWDLVATGDGIQNTTMSAVDLTDEDEIADLIIPIYLGAVPTSISVIWGNDLTANYWTGVAQTAQADGTAFRVGWNLIKVPWSTATETGTVDVTAIDSVKITVAKATALADIRVDNIQVSIGYPFEIKYYTKLLFQTAAGVFESRPSADESLVLCDNDSLQIFLLELLIAIAHQVEGTDSTFDISFANTQLPTLYQTYKGEHPDESVRPTANYGSLPRFKR